MERGNDQYVILQLYLQPLLKVKGSFDHLLPLIFFCASQMAQRVEESTCHCRRCKFNPWVRKIPWRRKWQPTPEFLPGKSHGQRNLAGYSPWTHKRVRHDLATKQQHSRVLGIMSATRSEVAEREEPCFALYLQLSDIIEVVSRKPCKKLQQ